MEVSLNPPEGTGPGVQTEDGCSVEFYLRTPYAGEVDGIESYVQQRSILELGSGVGRLTRPLLSMEAAVTAVDSSLEMLAHVPEAATTVHSTIESLQQPGQFDAVLLASYIYNSPDPNQRVRIAQVAKQHLIESGSFLLQVQDSDRLFVPGKLMQKDDGTTLIETAEEISPGLWQICIRYTLTEGEWTHAFTTQLLTIEEIRSELEPIGFTSIEWVDRNWGWILAR